MLTGDPIGGETGRSPTADWRNWLANDPLLTPGLRESHRPTLEGFDRFRLKRGSARASDRGPGAPVRPSVASARE
jgi:hypothetical protein